MVMFLQVLPRFDQAWHATCPQNDMRVLFATDGSKEAAAALRTSIRLLNASDRQIDLLCVAPKPSSAQRHPEQYKRRILRESTQILERARGLVPPETAVNMRCAIGSPAAVIVQQTEEYDLTVIGPKGTGAKTDNALGPVASRVIEHARGPVLVAREVQSEGGLRALIAVDGSDASCRAIETFRSLFDSTGAEVCLMHVAETPWIHLGLGDDWESYDDDEKDRSEAGTLETELVREGDLIIEHARELLRPLEVQVSVTTRMEEGNPADQILSEADRGQYDLVVLGATGRRDLKHSMLGSVSTKIAWNASASVLIVREPD